MELKEAIFTRRSVRHFIKKDVSQEQIEKILRAAMAAPSAVNQEALRYIVIRDRELLKTLSEVSSYATPLATCNVGIVVVGYTGGAYPEGLEQDLGAAVQNMWLQATEEGLGAIWLGISPEKRRMELVKQDLKLADNIIPLALFAIGYKNEENSGISKNIPDPYDRYDEDKIIYK